MKKSVAIAVAVLIVAGLVVYIDLDRREVRVSSILDWFGEDFGPTPQEALARLAEYMPDHVAWQLIERGDFSVEYLDYDWSLNKQ